MSFNYEKKLQNKVKSFCSVRLSAIFTYPPNHPNIIMYNTTI